MLESVSGISECQWFQRPLPVAWQSDAEAACLSQESRRNSVLARATLDAEHILTRYPSREEPPPEIAVQVYGAEQPAALRAPAAVHGIE